MKAQTNSSADGITMQSALETEEESVSHSMTAVQDDAVNGPSLREAHEDSVESITESDRFCEASSNVLHDSHDCSYKTPPNLETENASHDVENSCYSGSVQLQLSSPKSSHISCQHSTPPLDGGGDHQMPLNSTESHSNAEMHLIEEGGRGETKPNQGDSSTNTNSHDKTHCSLQRDQNLDGERERQKRGTQKKSISHIQNQNLSTGTREDVGKRRNERKQRSSNLDTRNVGLTMSQNDYNATDAVQLQSYAFNQDHSCFVCATTGGIRVYACNPLREFVRREWSNGGCRVAGMLYRTNVFAIVSVTESKKIKLWNEQKQRFIGELRCRQAVKNVCLGRDILAMVTEYTIYVYQSEEMRPFSVINTGANSKGLCVVSSGADKDEWKVACPAVAVGAVRIQTSEGERTSHVFQAHQSVLAAMAFNFQGTMLVTASEIGTVIRVFSSCDGQLLHEFRRGTHSNIISCVTFRHDNSFLAVASSSCTVHIFKLEEKENFHRGALIRNEAARKDNRQSNQNRCLEASFLEPTDDSVSEANAYLSTSGAQIHNALNVGKEITSVVYDASKEIVHDALKGVLPRYFSAARSFAQFRIPSDHQSIDVRSPASNIVGPLCAFSIEDPNNLYLIHHNGLLYEIQFNPHIGEECTLLTATTWFAPRRDFQIQTQWTSSLPSELEGGHEGDDWQLVM